MSEVFPVLIAGGGPVGLTLAALLARQGVASVVVEADTGYCTGSRAICMSRRSQEILGWVGADVPLVQKGLSWVGGRSYWRSTEVLQFRMPSEPTQRFAPMVNIQQFYVEEFAHRAAQQFGGLSQVRWGSRVVAVRPGADSVQVDVDGPEGLQTLQARYLVACDGGRSTVREQLGLQLAGHAVRRQVRDRGHCAEDAARPVERLAWFDPPSNPGSTILMHRQPDDVWRIDYQIRDDEDPAEAVKPENVLPRVAEPPGHDRRDRALGAAVDLHLQRQMPHAWTKLPAWPRAVRRATRPTWCPSSACAGSTRAWTTRATSPGSWRDVKLRRPVAPDACWTATRTERVHATRENIAYGAKSTEFMAPPRLRLPPDARGHAAPGPVSDPQVRPLINPRQSAPVVYSGSALNVPPVGHWAHDLAAPGAPAPEALLAGPQGPLHLTSLFGGDFVCLVFSDGTVPGAVKALVNHGVGVLAIEPEADLHGQARQRYGLVSPQDTALVLVRPDGYVMGRWRGLDAAPLLAALQSKGLLP
jgi:3-(3-hydroxy-phenyl)propionate hydroxylase